jgi:type I restriction enzyme S subunit
MNFFGLSETSKFKFPLPPTLTEQKAIADALTDVDELITNLENLIAKKKAIKQGAMQQLLTPPHKGGKRLDGFSRDWVQHKVGDLFDISGGYSATREQLSDIGYCYLHYGDIHGASKTFISTKSDFESIHKLNISLKEISSK